MGNFIRRKVIIMVPQKFVLILILQVVLSLICIIRKRNFLSYLVEILIPSIAFCVELRIFNKPFNLYELLIYLLTYIFAKLLILCIVQTLKKAAFHIAVEVSQNTKKQKANRKAIQHNLILRCILKFRTIKYGPVLKLGVPAMVNKTHKETGVRFDKKGFPIFNKVYYTVVLSRKHCKLSREEHFRIASRILYKESKYSRRLQNKFTKKELQILSQGKVPPRLTWHHHQDKGKLQLVDYKIHSKVSHTGGFSIWGDKKS